MVYHRYLHENDTFPRPKNPGELYMSPVHGAGQVTSTIYVHSTKSWLTEVQYHSGARDTSALPVVGILMFPAGSVASPLVPQGEKNAIGVALKGE